MFSPLWPRLWTLRACFGIDAPPRVGQLRGMRLGLSLSLAVLLLDQLTKQWMLNLIFTPPRRVELTSFFNLTPVWNYGISFGMFQADGWGRWVLMAITAAIVGILVSWLRSAQTCLARASLGLIIGGAVGNLLDRFVYGAVIDFLDFHYGGWHWPTFNVADMFITVGVGLLLIDHFTNGEKDAK